MIRRRHVFQREPDTDFREVFAEIRRLSGWGTADLCFVLNVPRSTLASWEVRGSIPNHPDGQAILALLKSLHPPEHAGIPAR